MRILLKEINLMVLCSSLKYIIFIEPNGLDKMLSYFLNSAKSWNMKILKDNPIATSSTMKNV